MSSNAPRTDTPDIRAIAYIRHVLNVKKEAVLENYARAKFAVNRGENPNAQSWLAEYEVERQEIEKAIAVFHRITEQYIRLSVFVARYLEMRAVQNEWFKRHDKGTKEGRENLALSKRLEGELDQIAQHIDNQMKGIPEQGALPL